MIVREFCNDNIDRTAILYAAYYYALYMYGKILKTGWQKRNNNNE